MRILIIDDDQNITSIWTVVLKNAGFEVIHAVTGRDGIEQAKKNLPNFILLDQIMPDMKGNDVLKAIKEDPQTKAIPIALISNYNENTLMQDAINAGAVDYILKYQIDPQDLVEKVNSLAREAQGAAAQTQ
ncbi:MAG: response regulator [Patescibacteria group bacterium]